MIQWPIDNFADRFFSNSIYCGSDVRLIDLAISVFERDQFTCRFCEFKCNPIAGNPTAFFQIRAVDNNYRNLVKDNLACVCPFCHSHFNLRASLRSGDYIPIRHKLFPTQLSILCKALLVEMSSKKNSLYDSASAFYKELEGFSSNISLPDFTTLHIEAEDAGERARKARTAFILNIVALSDGGGYGAQTKVALNNIHPLPRWSSFTALADFYEKNCYSSVRRSEPLMKLFSRM